VLAVQIQQKAMLFVFQKFLISEPRRLILSILRSNIVLSRGNYFRI